MNLDTSMQLKDSPKDSPKDSMTHVIAEVATSAKDLFQSEISLIEKQVKELIEKVGKETRQLAIFACLMLMSSFPILAFLIIGLGELLDGRYWLSSLIIGVLCFGGSAIMLSRSMKKLKEENLGLDAAQNKMKKAGRVVGNKLSDVTNALQGGLT